MKIFITGGTGFVGSGLVQGLAGPDREIVLLTRSSKGKRPRDGVTLVEGDPRVPGGWEEAAADAQVVINLAGASIFQRWTDRTKKEIMDSRILTAGNLVRVMSSSPIPGRVFLSASAVGYYGARGDETLTESSSSGNDFLAQVTKAWEAEAMKADKAGVRTVIMRFGVVLEDKGGALGQMMPLFRLGLGGRLGSGKQWFSWIHRSDLVGAAEFLLQNKDVDGAFNFTAPEPVSNSAFTAALAKVLRRPAFLPAPAFALKIVLGEFAGVLLEGQKVLPKRLEELGFEFRFPDIDSALGDILRTGTA